MVHSQIEQRYFIEILDQTNKFDEIVERVERYYEENDKGKGSGYKQWKRWENFYSTRLMPDGTVPNLSSVESDVYNKNAIFSKKGKSKSSVAAGLEGDWSSMGPDGYTRFGQGYNGGIGRINCIAVDPDNDQIVYVGTPAGGLWKSNTGGDSWIPLTDDLPTMGVSGIAIDYSSPVNDRTIFILTGDGDGEHTKSNGILKSIDNGATWVSTGLSWDIDNIVGYKLLMHPTNPNEMLVATSHTVYKTIDGAVTWTRTIDYERIYDIEYKPGNPQYVYASGAGNILRSTDGGDSWNELSGANGLPSSYTRVAIAVTPDAPDYVYAIYGEVTGLGSMKGLYRSTDSGNSFSLRADAPNILGYNRYGTDDLSQSFYDLAIAVSPINADEVHVGGINCWKSSNGGGSWINTSYWYESSAGNGNYTHADIHALEFVGEVLYSGTDGGIYKTTNGASDWEDISSGLVISQMYRIGLDPTNPNRLLHGSQDNGSNKIENGGYYHWYGADGFGCIVDPSNPDRIYGSFQNGGIIRSDDNGTTLTTINDPRDIDEGGDGREGNWDTPFTLDPDNSNIIYAGFRDVWKSTNRGDSWVNITDGDIGFGDCTQIEIAPSNSNYIYVTKSNYVYYSKDGGATWGQSDQFKYSTKTYIAIHPTNPNIIWVTVGGFNEGEKVLKSTDGGVNFTNASGSLPNIPVNCIVYEYESNNGLYVGTDLGVFYINDDISDWVSYAQNLPNTIVKELAIQYTTDKLFAGTFGRGMWVSPLYPLSSDTYRNADVPSNPVQGLSYAYYEGEWSILPEFDSLIPIKEGVLNTINVSPKEREVNFGIEYDGYINIPADGEYIFYLSSDDGSKLFIGNNEVINHDEIHAPAEKQGSIKLKKGLHSFRIPYFQAVGGSQLSLQYSGPDIIKQVVSQAMFFMDEKIDGTTDKECISSTNSDWKNYVMTTQTGTFECSFSVEPGLDTMDAVIGLSNEDAVTYSDMGVIVRFNTSGYIDVRDGSNYSSTLLKSYKSGTTYDIRIKVDLDNKKYDVYVQDNNHTEQLLADDFNFRTEQASVSVFNNWATYGNTGTLVICDFEILESNENQAPQVAMTSPLANTTYEEGDTITLSSTATDIDGTIVNVTWYQNDTEIRSDSGAPYSKPWENVAAGSYEIKAKAEDDQGAITWSTSVNINVLPAQNSICNTSSDEWSGVVAENQNSFFRTSFNVIPNDSNMDGVIGMSNGDADAYADLAVIVRLNQDGEFDVRNGSSYASSTIVSYTAGATYNISLEVDLASKKYDVYVTSPSGETIRIADDFAFRSDQSGVGTLNNWNWKSGVGSLQVCDPFIIPVFPGASLGVREIHEWNGIGQISMYPNPATDEVVFSIGNNNELLKAEIMDLYGKLVLSTNEKMTNILKVNTSKLSNGIYFIRIYVNKEVVNKKLIIKK
ncbi:hypothetical protein GCM10022393_13290 [Aquimarina addita]|uniref:PA14 domain-containing protein n=2 Tax=Aquimarina addita TaxID=870485 RepID=A0ABP7XEW3_9FLAO